MHAPDISPVAWNAEPDSFGPEVTRLAADLRWFDAAPDRRRAVSLALILVASVVLHGLLAFGVDWVDSLVGEPKPTTDQEVPVEVVNEVPGETPRTEPPPAPVRDPSQQSAAVAQPPAAPASPPRPEPAPAPQPPAPQPAPAVQPPAPPTLPPAPSTPPEEQPAPTPVEPPPLRQALVDPPRAAQIIAPTRPDGPSKAEDTGPAAAAPPLPDAAGVMFLPDTFKMVATAQTPTASKEELDSYKSIVFDRVIRNRQFPENARKRGAAGIAVVTFVLDPAGNLAGASLMRSTGDRELDAEALAMVKRSAPFPKPPQGAVLTFTPLIEFGRGD